MGLFARVTCVCVKGWGGRPASLKSYLFLNKSTGGGELAHHDFLSYARQKSRDIAGRTQLRL